MQNANLMMFKIHIFKLFDNWGKVQTDQNIEVTLHALTTFYIINMCIICSKVMNLNTYGERSRVGVAGIPLVPRFHQDGVVPLPPLQLRPRVQFSRPAPNLTK